ncbi:MAG: tripartite tricarboxylate transporter substrate binding protein [Pseudomonas sp.]
MFNTAVCTGLFCAAHASRAAAWPEKPVRIILPFAAGSSPDAGNRVFANELAIALSQPVIIENRPGANGITGTVAALAAAPDGYTLLSINVGTLAINPFLFPKQKYDPLKDLTIISIRSSTANVLAVRPDLPAKTVGELVALGKTGPNALTMGSSGTGTTGHLSGELFKEMTGVHAVHVPYRGSAAAYTDLMSGRVDFMFDNLVSVGAHAKEGRVRILAVTSAVRSELMPDVPTLQEAGLKGYEIVSWGGLGVPRETPQSVVGILKVAAEKANNGAAVLAFNRQNGLIPINPMNDAQAVAFVKAEQDKWAALIRRSGAANI